VLITEEKSLLASAMSAQVSIDFIAHLACRCMRTGRPWRASA